MARNPKAASPTSDESEDESLVDLPMSIDPYKTLDVETTATPDQIKSAYRKAALRHHPDKAAPEAKETAHQKFQEIAFAYAILSDETRRRRFDTTGNTAESLDDDDFDWVDFFREQTAAMVDGAKIDEIKKEYQGSSEEKTDVLRVFAESEGSMDVVYEEIMCSNVLDDDKRFRSYIDEAIAGGQVENFRAYAKESKSTRARRLKQAKSEENEAMDLAEELGVAEKLFGKQSTKKTTTKKSSGEDALAALIQQRQQSRSENFLDQLEAKYGGSRGQKKKRVDEPPEEMFAQNAQKKRSKRS